MEKENQNEKILSRRDFFKNAAKKALPILGAVALVSIPSITKAAQTKVADCNYGCTGSCEGLCTSCTGTCSGTCTGSCTGGCTGACTSACRESCGQNCSGNSNM